ncbi:14405_t:CDS:2, partial [Gigaspora margarita]
LYPNTGNFEEFNAQPNKDNRIQYSLNLTSESFLNPKYNIENCYKNLKINVKYNNINILFILVKNHEHVSHMELLTDIIITINLINDLSFRYQSDKIHEFITILRRYNPQNILNVCEKDSVVTIYNKESLNFYCKQHLDVKNIKVQKRKVDIRKYQIKLTQEEIDKLMVKYLNKAVNASANPKKIFNITFRKINNENYIDQLKYFHGNMIFNDEIHKIITETVRKIFNSAFKNTCESDDLDIPEFLQYSKEKYESQKMGCGQRRKLSHDEPFDNSDGDDIDDTSSTMSHSEFRRQIHVQSEQKRHAEINDGFEELRRQLPTTYTGRKMSKTVLLQKAVSHIKNQSRKGSFLLDEINRLSQTCVYLSEELEKEKKIRQERTLEKIYAAGL